jgi:hypothetical protein
MWRRIPLVAAWLAAPLLLYGAEPARAFAVVVHRSNPTRDMRLRDLTGLFGGSNRQWPNNSPVVLVERDAGSAPFRYLMQRLLNTTPGEYKRNLQNIEYRGDAPVSVKVLNSDAAACQFVFNVPAAVAIIETASLATPECGQIQVVRIEGKTPGEEGYRLQ